MWPHTYLMQYLVLVSGPVSWEGTFSDYSKSSLCLVKTCGVPLIDESEMGNKSVRLGDAVTFNCKVRGETGSFPTTKIFHNLFPTNILRLHMGWYSNKNYKWQWHALTIFYKMTQWKLDMKWQHGQKTESIAQIVTAIILYLWKVP